MENDLVISEHTTSENLQEMFKAYGSSTKTNKNSNQGRIYFTKESMQS